MSESLLSNINSPEDVKALNEKQLDQLCAEIRHELIGTVSHTGGHLASNLGAVELTVALHRVFNSPDDQIVFDVGHQCYTHKLLTGRRERFSTLRTEGGISGFPKPSESEHDPLIAGHSSNSVSAAFGLAKANTLQCRDNFVIAVIGDGALTGGLAYEGLNNAGRGSDNLIVILNDNKMSINKNVGALAKHLAVLRSRRGYVRMKTGIAKTFGAIPVVGKKINKMLFASKSAIKHTIYKGTIFEDMGFVYMGPVDGHNISLLERVLETAKAINRPVLVHICTLKGKGYPYAEKMPKNFHGIGSFDADTGEQKFGAPTYSSVFGDAICELAANDDKICAITAAMKSGTALDRFSEEYRHRFFDVGIAEAHAVAFSSGLAANGMKPVFAVYSSFSQRAYDQLIHDSAIGHENVTLVIDRAGIVGEDGETHQGLFDTCMLNPIPGFEVYSPAYFDEISYTLKKAVDYDGPAAIRIPRGTQAFFPEGLENSFSDYSVFYPDGKVLIVTYGRLAGHALKAALSLRERNIAVSVMKLLKISPLPDGCIEQAGKYSTILFFEESMKKAGIGETFAEALLENNYSGRFVHRAVDNIFVSHSTVASALSKLGLDSDGMEALVCEVLDK